MARKKIIQKSKGKARGAAPPLSLKNLSPLAWIFSAKGRSCSRGRGLGAWGRHLMVPELALRRARENLVFFAARSAGKNQVFLWRAAPGKKIRCFLRRAAPENDVFLRRAAPDFHYFCNLLPKGVTFLVDRPCPGCHPEAWQFFFLRRARDRRLMVAEVSKNDAFRGCGVLW